MSHREREHAHGTAERGNDWLDGALAGWLLFIAISAGQLAWYSVRDGGPWQAIAVDVAAPVLAVAAIFPLLRFHRVGWLLAVLTLTLMAVREGVMLAAGEAGWRSTAAFLVVNLLGLAYLLWIVPEFWPPRHAEAAPAAVPAAPAVPTQAAASAGPATSAPAGPTPVAHAVAAIHHRIVAAGSACAVTAVSVRAEAGRFGVTPAALRTEGLALYRTFLRHFMADGSLSPDEERELICLERALDLDDDGVWRLRAEAGLVGGPGSPAPLPPARDGVLPEPRPVLASPAAADADMPAGRTDAGPDGPGTPWTNAVGAPAPAPAREAASGSSLDEPPAPSPDALADYEEHELGALMGWAGIVALPRGTAPRTALERLRALHRTGTEPLEACASDHPLEAGEQCLSIRTVELYRVPPGTPSAEPAADVPGPVLDPLVLVDGSLELERDLSTFQRTGVCRFLLTQRRLLLVARSGQQSPLPLGQVRSVRPFRNGLEVRPHRGRPVFLAFTGGVDDVAMRVDRAVRDLRA